MRYIACAILFAAVVGCGEAPISEAPQLSLQGDNPNALVFPNVAQPYGARLATWADRESQWVYGQPLDHNPLIDQTGADCAVAQQGAVWFIPRIAGPRVFSGSRSCTIPIGTCVTGSPQPAIVDGFFMMFRPLPPGAHTIRVFGTDVRGANKTYLYYLTIE